MAFVGVPSAVRIGFGSSLRFGVSHHPGARSVSARRDMTVMGMKLYVKAAEDKKSLGDCPFCHKAFLMLNAKGADYEMEPVDMSDKPDWYLKLNEKGTVPTLVDGEEIIADSELILTYAEQKYPEPTMIVEDEAASAAIGPLFGSMAGYLKNQDAEKEKELLGAFEDALENLNTCLEGKTYVAGDKMSTLDFNLSPKLWHAKHALAKYKSYTVPDRFPNVIKYMDTMFTSEVFTKTLYGPEVVEWGWSKFFK